MKSTKLIKSKTEAETGQLVLRAVVAQKQAELARKRARRAKAHYRSARKAFKKAKKVARQARKLAKAATKAFTGVKRRAAQKTKKKSPSASQPKMDTKKPKSRPFAALPSKLPASGVITPPSPSVAPPSSPEPGDAYGPPVL